MREYSPDLVQLAARLYEDLKSGNKVAKRLDVSHSTAYRLLNAAGVKLPGRHSAEVQQRKKTLHGELAKAAADDYAAGMKADELRAKYRVGMWAIRTAAKDAGVTMRNRGGRYRMFSAADKAEAIRLYCVEGLSQASIAAHFSSHQITVSRMLRAAGVKTRWHGAKGSDHASWNGGIVKQHEYLAEWVDNDDPLAAMRNTQGYVMQHRLVMARELGRPLLAWESVHHINGDPKDNRLSNLQLRFGKHGKGVSMICANCGSHEIKYQALS